MLNWLLGLWHAQRRAFDLKYLWPACCDEAPDLDHAKAAFAYHAFHDTAWLWIGEKKIVETIDKLEPPK